MTAPRAAEPVAGVVADAIAELRELRSSDPAARAAVHAIKLTQLTLETLWSPPDQPA